MMISSSHGQPFGMSSRCSQSSQRTSPHPVHLRLQVFPRLKTHLYLRQNEKSIFIDISGFPQPSPEAKGNFSEHRRRVHNDYNLLLPYCNSYHRRDNGKVPWRAKHPYGRNSWLGRSRGRLSRFCVLRHDLLSLEQAVLRQTFRRTPGVCPDVNYFAALFSMLEKAFPQFQVRLNYAFCGASSTKVRKKIMSAPLANVGAQRNRVVVRDVSFSHIICPAKQCALS